MNPSQRMLCNNLDISKEFSCLFMEHLEGNYKGMIERAWPNDPMGLQWEDNLEALDMQFRVVVRPDKPSGPTSFFGETTLSNRLLVPQYMGFTGAVKHATRQMSMAVIEEVVLGNTLAVGTFNGLAVVGASTGQVVEIEAPVATFTGWHYDQTCLYTSTSIRLLS